MMKDLGAPLMRRECDEVLRDLALVLPRAGLGPDEIDRMLDLYCGLLRDAGVTHAMLSGAAKAYVMAPKKGKPRFFPDPGELAEMCAESAARRKHDIRRLQSALDILDGKISLNDGQTVDDRAIDISKRLHELAKSVRSPTSTADHRKLVMVTSRDTTDAEELTTALSHPHPQKARA